MPTGAIQSRVAALAQASARAIATATVDDPSMTGGANDLVQKVAIDTATMYVALQEIGDVLTQQQDQITQLQASAFTQGEHTARMEASIRTLGCPNNVQDPMFKERRAIAIGDCIDGGTCTCDLITILESAPLVQPPLDQPPIELVPDPPIELPPVTVPAPPELATPVS